MCGEGSGGPVTTSVVKPCSTCGVSGESATTSALAVITAGAGRPVQAGAGAGLAIVVVAAALL